MNAPKINFFGIIIRFWLVSMLLLCGFIGLIRDIFHLQ